MKKSDINPMPQYFDRFINTVADVELPQAFDDSIEQLNRLDKILLANLDGKPYAPGKWTAKGIIQHVTDFERIFAYRALLFARREGSIPQDIDPDRLAANMNAEKRRITALIEKLKIVRTSTKSRFVFGYGIGCDGLG